MYAQPQLSRIGLGTSSAPSSSCDMVHEADGKFFSVNSEARPARKMNIREHRRLYQLRDPCAGLAVDPVTRSDNFVTSFHVGRQTLFEAGTDTT